MATTEVSSNLIASNGAVINTSGGKGTGVTFNAGSALGKVSSGVQLVNDAIGLGQSVMNLINGNTGITGQNDEKYNTVRELKSLSPTEWLSQHIINTFRDHGIIRYLYSNLFRDLFPDISGYVLLFMAPPTLSGYQQLGNNNYNITDAESFFSETAKIVPLLATNFTPPSLSLNTGVIKGGAGTQHFAQDLNITDTMSVTYVDNINLDIYSFHATWINYIYHILEGSISPRTEFITNRQIDYAASFYFVKFQPDLQQMQYIGKAIGCYPKELPSQDLISTRSTNDLTNVTFNYTVSDYREALMNQGEHWLFTELQQLIFSYFTSKNILMH